jgi:hypothetical protein
LGDKYPAYTSDKVSHETMFLNVKIYSRLFVMSIQHMLHNTPEDHQLAMRSKLDKNGDNEGRDQLKRPGFSQSLKTKLNDILCKDKVDYKNLGEERKAAG